MLYPAMGNKTNDIQEDYHIPDPHDVLLGFFETSNKEPILAGTIKQFILRTIFAVIVLVGVRVLYENTIPSIEGVASALLVGSVSVLLVTALSSYLIPALFQKRTWLFFSLILVFIAGAGYGLG